MVHLGAGTQAHHIYSSARNTEVFACNYGLNDAFSDKLLSGDLYVSGRDEDGAVRVVELRGHPFYIATLYVPQMNSSPEKPHPLIVAYLRAAVETRAQ